MQFERLKWFSFYWPGLLRGLCFEKNFRFILNPKTRVELRKLSQLHIQDRLIFGYPDRAGQARVFNHGGELCLGANAHLNIEGNVEFCPGSSLILTENARFTIGANTTFAGDSYFVITGHSKIGKDCRFSWGINFLDSDLHELRNRHGEVTNLASAITLGDRIWVSHRVSILKGVSIGDDSIIAAGAVVTKSFPARSILAGVPAQKIGEFDGQWSLGKHFLDG